MSRQKAYVIGVDYGTDSVRAIIVNTATGEERVASVLQYPRWRDGLCLKIYFFFKDNSI